MQQKEGDNKVVQFFQVEPESIYDAITMYENHNYQMILAYSFLCNVLKENVQTGEFIKSDRFEIQIKEAFNSTTSIISTGFIAYIEKFFLNTNDILLLEKVYNFLTVKMNELLRQQKRLKFNPSYPHYNTLYENANHKLILYLSPLGNEVDANGNYKEVKNYFTGDNLFDAIVLDLKETKNKIDSLFTLKKLNEKSQNNSLGLIESDKETVELITPEIMPEYEYKTVQQKIAWLHELGILKTVLDNCKEGETYVLRRAANVIHSFTGIDAGTIRKSLEAIYQPNKDNKKNHPLNNPLNKLFVADMAAKFKLNKEKEN